MTVAATAAIGAAGRAEDWISSEASAAARTDGGGSVSDTPGNGLGRCCAFCGSTFDSRRVALAGAYNETLSEPLNRPAGE